MEKNLFKTSKIGVLTLIAAVFMVSSCCPESELNLSEVKVCSTAVDDLEEAECSSHENSISTSSVFTVSTLTYHAESDSELTYRVFAKVDNEWILQNGLTVTKDLSDFADECGAKSAQEYSPVDEWPEAEIKVEVELNSDPIQTVSRTFRLE